MMQHQLELCHQNISSTTQPYLCREIDTHPSQHYFKYHYVVTKPPLNPTPRKDKFIEAQKRFNTRNGCNRLDDLNADYSNLEPFLQVGDGAMWRDFSVALSRSSKGCKRFDVLMFSVISQLQFMALKQV